MKSHRENSNPLKGSVFPSLLHNAIQSLPHVRLHMVNYRTRSQKGFEFPRANLASFEGDALNRLPGRSLTSLLASSQLERMKVLIPTCSLEAQLKRDRPTAVRAMLAPLIDAMTNEAQKSWDWSEVETLRLCPYDLSSKDDIIMNLKTARFTSLRTLTYLRLENREGNIEQDLKRLQPMFMNTKIESLSLNLQYPLGLLTPEVSKSASCLRYLRLNRILARDLLRLGPSCTQLVTFTISDACYDDEVSLIDPAYYRLIH